MSVKCPTCGQPYRGSTEHADEEVFCPNCGKRLSQEEAAPPQGPEPPGEDYSAEDSCDDHCLLLGKLALKYRFLDSSQLNEALEAHREEKKKDQNSLLGSLLIRRGLLTQKQLDFLLAVQEMMAERKLDRHFGAIAVKNGFVTSGQVEAALKEQERIFKENRKVKKIGELLVESGALEPSQRDAILKRQERLKELDQQERRQPEEAEAVESDTSLLQDLFDLKIQSDSMTAYLTPRRKIPAEVSADQVLAFLDEKGVRHGLPIKEDIEWFLRTVAHSGETFTIARGTPPEPGRDSKIIYYFDTDPLRVGTLKEGGTIDFKDKGELPQVKAGDLLAEWIPPQEGTPGTDVYGRPAPPPKPKTRKLKRGKGAVVSEDGLKLLAEMSGRPEVAADGKVFVFPEHKIQGDVDLKTGHVDFDGDIQVTGSVKDGFRVSGGSLTADEILAAEIDIRGDVGVFSGVIGAAIRAGGNIRARYIHKARILAFGDVVVEKEIIDSEIETSGACIVKKGPILSSKVTAKKGVEAFQVGSETSNPCVLTVGTEGRVKREIQGYKERIDTLRETMDAVQRQIEELREEKRKVEKELAETAQLQDAAMVKQRQLNEKIQELEQGGDQELLSKAKALLEKMKAEAKDRDAFLESLFSREEEITQTMAPHNARNEEIENQIQALKGEIQELSDWAKTEKPVPVVKVRGTIFPFTTLKGAHATLTLPEGHQHLQIKEVHVDGAESGKRWKMRLSSLKKK
ncbi:MAG: FapA family protein [Desulfobacteraceae bacterium]